ncbi:MAG: hypothetical protein MUO40_06950 [Anaerolineaceae bacterium]|nr:hypothetical protein [Anaerolineaceae bacterium]
MKKNEKNWLLSSFKNNELYYLSSGALMYLLGIATASYLSYTIRLGTIFLGLVCVIVILLLETMIDLYIRQVKNATAKTLSEKNRSSRKQLTTLAIIASALMIIAVLVFLISRNDYLSAGSWVLLSIIFILSIVKSTPFIRIKNNAYLEIIEGVIVAVLIPSLSFSLLTGELHRFLPIISLPLLFIYFASRLALAFPKFAGDVAKGRNSLLISLGWQRGAFLHDLFILLGFCTLGLSSLVGLPWQIAWPALIALPVGIFEIWQLYRLSKGSKPNWKLLKVTAGGLFIFPAYLLIFTLFTN